MAPGDPKVGHPYHLDCFVTKLSCPFLNTFPNSAVARCGGMMTDMSCGNFQKHLPREGRPALSCHSFHPAALTSEGAPPASQARQRAALGGLGPQGGEQSHVATCRPDATERTPPADAPHSQAQRPPQGGGKATPSLHASGLVVTAHRPSPSPRAEHGAASPQPALRVSRAARLNSGPVLSPNAVPS